MVMFKAKKEKQRIFRQRISQESYKLCRTLESCETPDNLESAAQWCDAVMERWEFLVSKWSQRDVNKVTPFVQIINDQVTESYKQKEQELLALIEEEKEPKPLPPIHVTGFC